MQVVPALLNYQGRVVWERKRIEKFMLSQDEKIQDFWAKTRTTRRLSLGAESQLHAWSVAGRKLYSISASAARFDFDAGVTAIVVLSTPDSSVVIQKLEVGRSPVHLGDDVFIAVDAIEPFVSTPDGEEIRLLVYCGASPHGRWIGGTVVGTDDEFNLKFADYK